MNELSYYTLAHGDAAFIHQHVVDAYGAQHIRGSASSIGAAFALAGLYLAIERRFTGRQVQKMHVLMARASKQWPRFDRASDVGPFTVADVLAAAAERLVTRRSCGGVAACGRPGPRSRAACARWSIGFSKAQAALGGRFSSSQYMPRLRADSVNCSKSTGLTM